MNAYRCAASCTLLLFSACLRAQARPEVSYFNNVEGSQRSFAMVVQSSVVTINGGGQPMSALTRYAQTHGGTYIVFTDGEGLRRLDNSERLAEAQHIYEPMRALASQQKALAAQQRPLAAEQQALAAQQRAATDPHEMTRIGAVQSAVGTQQGDIGRLQGAVGQQQGELGRAFHSRVEAMLDACVADASCPRVPTEAAQR